MKIKKKNNKQNKKGINSKGTKKLSLFSLLITLCLLPLIISIIILSSVSLYVTKGNLEQAAKDTLFVVANNLANHCKENEINAINVTEYYNYLDSLKEQNIEMAIILEGAPCTTSIKNENDYRIREISFKKDVLAEREQLKGGYYEENVIIEGAAYYTYCMPIEVNGEITGIAFAGQKQEYVTGAIGDIVTLFIGAAALLVVIFAVIGAIGSVISQIGDLVASAIKRNFEIKDYGRIIPGHGGIMDRFDSVIFTGPIIFFLAYYLI